MMKNEGVSYSSGEKLIQDAVTIIQAVTTHAIPKFIPKGEMEDGMGSIPQGWEDKPWKPWYHNRYRMEQAQIQKAKVM